jgi:signal transduction histidine kinase/ActR/RegA family two-component response regulator
MQGKLSTFSDELSPSADLRGSAEHEHAALAKLPGSVFRLLRSVDGRWTLPFAGQELPRLFLSSATALAADPTAIADHMPPEDLERLKHHLQHSRETGQALKTRFRIRPPGADEVWLEVTAAPELSFSGGTLWHGFLADVTADQRINRELRHLHKRWTLAARAAGIGVMEFDLRTARLSFDAIACAHHGMTGEQSTLELRSWIDLIAPEDRLVAHTALNSMPLDGFAECLVLRLAAPIQGAVRTLEFMFQAVSDADRLVGTCRDITQQQTLEAMRRDKLAAEQANRSKGEFMSRVSHELRTPLNGILGFVQLMALDRQHRLPPVHMRRLEVLRQSGSRLLALIDQMLDVSRIDDGRLLLRPGGTDVGALVDQCVAAAYPQARARGVEITVEVPPNTEPVQADAQALEQVLTNLLSNAIKYNRPQGRIRVRFEATELGRLIVDDTGVGMSEAQLSRLFEPFNRLGAERTGVGGSGLGLVIAKKLVDAMGGELEVQSLVGRGSRFQVSLPLAERSRATEAAEPPQVMPSEWGGDAQHTVLYVEDDEINTLLMEQVFESQPAWQLITAATAAEGLRAAMSNTLSVILLDLHLPDASGFEVLERLKADPRTRQTRCIAVSADVLPEQINEALARGFDGYWTKPLDLIRIVTELKQLLRTDLAA